MAVAVKGNLYTVKIMAYIAEMARKSEVGRTRVRRPANNVATSGAARKPSAPRAAGSSEATPYHHGALRDALLEAAERVLDRDGWAGLTLRAVAREAGVSHAAPTHHFGDLTGLVSELAAIGFRQFNTAMELADAAGNSPIEKALAGAKAYVAYAQAHPGMYGLMFRTEWLDMTRPPLNVDARGAFVGVGRAVLASPHLSISHRRLHL